MYILGLNLLHDTSAALIKDGKVIGAVEEERFNGIKHTDSYPVNAINWLMNENDLNINDVTIVTSYEFSKFKNNINPFEENTIKKDQLTQSGKNDIVNKNNYLYTKIKNDLKNNKVDNYIEIQHHISHAAGGYYSSGFEEASVLVVDGRGEEHSTSLYHIKKGKFKLIQNYPINESLGQLYTYVTELCGLYSSRGQEGKTMGLAAYGKYNPELEDLFNQIITIDDERYYISRTRMYELEKYRSKNITQISKDLAFTLQKHYERVLEFLTKKLVTITGCRNLVLSGGVALNCNGNGNLLFKELVDDIYIQPAANDAGTALGAALYHYYNQLEHPYLNNLEQEDVYLGPSYSNDEIRKVLDSCKIKYYLSSDITKEAAKIIADGNIIGWFQGAMEFGPRALGNRSILSDPRKKSMKDKVNNNVKYREEWRPFAPSILEEHALNYFSKCLQSPHMTISFKAHSKKDNEIAAAVHIDKTARVQTVNNNNNPLYYHLINEFYHLTGVPVLLNTSFNGPEPIVLTPRCAIRTFFSTGLDYLIMGDFIISKESRTTNINDSAQTGGIK
jgi:carbamoyltransferase